MTLRFLRSTILYEAVNSRDEDAQEVIVGWFRAAHADEEIAAQEDLEIDLSKAQGLNLWFIKVPGAVDPMLVAPEDYEEKFREVDPVEEFTAALDNAPTAQVAEEPEQRRMAQAQVDAFVAQRVSRMLDEFEDLLAMAQDQTDADASEGVEWAYERFKQVFGVTDL